MYFTLVSVWNRHVLCVGIGAVQGQVHYQTFRLRLFLKLCFCPHKLEKRKRMSKHKI